MDTRSHTYSINEETGAGWLLILLPSRSRSWQPHCGERIGKNTVQPPTVERLSGTGRMDFKTGSSAPHPLQKQTPLWGSSKWDAQAGSSSSSWEPLSYAERCSGHTPELPISGYAGRPAMQACRDNGVRGFVGAGVSHGFIKVKLTRNKLLVLQCTT